ncbi:hypothetical protein [Sinimarinibacterium thermocellulolyticum]|uniref:Uncharacterized protein n=1 Tax=Sinimarinibacterium thermocellulolyticum TaxID=3170016 RepID=A0ABV2ADN7_9GAMM
MSTFSKCPLAVALGAACALGGANAQASVLQATDVGSGYMVAAADHAASYAAQPYEGHCGGMHMMDGRCGEGMCGGNVRK